MKKKIFVFLFVIAAVVIYIVFYQKDKTLKFIPKNADGVVLIDVKKLVRQAIFNTVTNPSEWFTASKSENVIRSLKNSGVEIPDFVQIIHLNDSRLLEFYTVFDIAGQEQFKLFLKEQKIFSLDNDLLKNQKFYLRVFGNKCVVTNSTYLFEKVEKTLVNLNILHADQFIGNTTASISYINNQKITKFGIDFSEDEIEIKNTTNDAAFKDLIKNLTKENYTFNLELDQRNARLFSQVFNKNLIDSAQITAFKAGAQFNLVNDTIITYGYDDDFNETEKKAVQKILQPNFAAVIKSKNIQKTWDYFRNKKWINDDFQYVGLPVGLNTVNRNKNEMVFKSHPEKISVGKWQNQNYIFISNNVKFDPVQSNKNSLENKIISNLDYCFYGNKGDDYYLKIKFKKDKLNLRLFTE